MVLSGVRFEDSTQLFDNGEEYLIGAIMVHPSAEIYIRAYSKNEASGLIRY